MRNLVGGGFWCLNMIHHAKRVDLEIALKKDSDPCSSRLSYQLLQTDKLHREIHNWKRLAFIKYLSVPEIIPKAFSMNSPQSLSPHLLPAPALFHYSRSHHVLIAEPDV
jgi:hypothetical protein